MKKQTSPTTPATQLFGRPNWTMNTTQAGPVRGPLPRLSYGSQPGPSGEAGTNAQTGGFVSTNSYIPSPPFGYAPDGDATFQKRLPQSLPFGTDGRDLVGTYRPHDFAIATRWLTVARSAPNWQVMEYPPATRSLIQAQQVMKYNLQSYTRAHRPLDKTNYFLGYTTDPVVAAGLGGSTLGYMGG